MTDKPRRPAHPDIEIEATVSASELVFHDAPDTKVDFADDSGDESGSGSDRLNLPSHVRAEVAYRDVYVDYRLVAALPRGGDGQAG